MIVRARSLAKVGHRQALYSFLSLSNVHLSAIFYEKFLRNAYVLSCTLRFLINFFVKNHPKSEGSCLVWIAIRVKYFLFLSISSCLLDRGSFLFLWIWIED